MHRKIVLEDLVGDTEKFFAETWRRRPMVHHGADVITSLISEREIWESVDCGLLVRPYFVAFNEGVRSALSEITKPREVVGHKIPGYVNAEQVKQDFADGGTFKLNQPEHWLRAFHDLVESLGEELDAELETYVFLSPPDRKAIETHMDGSHVFVLQVAGSKDWTVGLLDEESLSVSDRYRGRPLTPETSFEVTLHPGDVLYMPHGSPHHAVARGGNSIHVAVTVEEPTPGDLAEVMLAQVTTDAAFAELDNGAYRRSPHENARLVRSLVAKVTSGIDPATTARKATDLRRNHWK
jgi:ribosomal protein L16 Arg81 hydroxylase